MVGFRDMLLPGCGWLGLCTFGLSLIIDFSATPARIVVTFLLFLLLDTPAAVT